MEIRIGTVLSIIAIFISLMAIHSVRWVERDGIDQHLLFLQENQPREHSVNVMFQDAAATEIAVFTRGKLTPTDEVILRSAVRDVAATYTAHGVFKNLTGRLAFSGLVRDALETRGFEVDHVALEEPSVKFNE